MILIAFFILILANIWLKKKTKYNLYPFIIVALILYSGLRYNYGFDFNNYLIHFHEIGAISDVIKTNYEKGYSLLVFVFKILGFGFNTFLLFIAFFSIKMKEKVFNKLSVLPDVSLLLYFLLFYIVNDVEQIRHGISIGFCFYSIVFLCENDKKSKIISFILIVLGILFHISAVLFIPIFFVKDKILNKKIYVGIFIISIFLSFINYFELLKIINDSLLHSKYLSLKINSYSTEYQSFLSLTLLIKCFILSVFSFYAFNDQNKLHRLLFNIYYIGIIYTILFSNIPILMARGTTYMRYAELLMIPIYMKATKNQDNRKLHLMITTLIFGYYIFKFITIVIQPEYFNYTSI